MIFLFSKEEKEKISSVFFIKDIWKMVGRAAITVAVALILAIAIPTAGQAEGSYPKRLEIASLPPSDFVLSEVELPEVLPAADKDRYSRIFKLQEAGKWGKADKLIRKLDDKVLLGHVRAQRYLHPTKYRSRYKELRNWLAVYHDHPQAHQLYKLALKRRPKNWKMPHKPTFQNYIGSAYTKAKPVLPPPPAKARTKAQRLEAQEIIRQAQHFVRQGWTKTLKSLLRTKRTKQILTQLEYDRIQAQLAFSYFIDGRDQWAVEWGARAVEQSGAWTPRASWTSGLALWRQGKIGRAARCFEAAAKALGQPGRDISAAAFWAARAHLVNHSPKKVSRWLEKAAKHPRTFYGILANRLLGKPMAMDWSLPKFSNSTLQTLSEKPAGRRALALIQIDDWRNAQRELGSLAAKEGEDFAKEILGLAVRTQMANLAIRLNEALYPAGQGFDVAAYPTPHWVPDGGFTVDRALVYALIRRESRFNPRAKSHRGARGLMQLTPDTASFVARDRRFRQSKRRMLFKPELNLTLGQKFIEILLSDDKIEGDVFQLAAAWNGGLGNLSKWRRHTKYEDDPLLFIESIPFWETRGFVKHVLSNLWIYRDRLDQSTPTLDAIAAGKQPAYVAQDSSTMAMAGNGGENIR